MKQLFEELIQYLEFARESYTIDQYFGEIDYGCVELDEAMLAQVIRDFAEGMEKRVQ